MKIIHKIIYIILIIILIPLLIIIYPVLALINGFDDSDNNYYGYFK